MSLRILFTGLELDDPRRFLGPLLDPRHELQVRAWDDDLPGLVRGQRFDGIAVGWQTTGLPLSRFLDAVRDGASRSRHAGVVLVSTPDRLPDAVAYLGQGVNRVVGSDVPHRLGQAITELLRVPPRLEVRAAARISPRLPGSRTAHLCQTANLSATGMLVRGLTRHPLGTVVDFDLLLPGDDVPLHGEAELCRRAIPGRERLQAFGARFLAFQSLDGHRLVSYLQRRLG